jgi:hypothetical protein
MSQLKELCPYHRPPDSNPGMWDLINLSIENALNSGVDNIVLSGDFNENLLNPNKTKGSQQDS